MQECEVCGNAYHDAFVVVVRGRRHVFDSFECAIHALAPHCASCGCRVIGHGVQHEKRIYCSAHCARRAGIDGAVDRV